MLTNRRAGIHIVADPRPNSMKIAPMVRALQADGRTDWKIVHTGQHYDRNTRDVLFEELGIPARDVRFNCGGDTALVQQVLRDAGRKERRPVLRNGLLAGRIVDAQEHHGK